MRAFEFNDGLRRSVRANLRQFPWSEIGDAGLRRAAVAIVITDYGDAGIPAIFLTRRRQRLGQHSGQYALPGGKLDQGETVYQAALRELDEELGLALAGDRILGRLDDYPTRSKFRITPVVVWAGEDCRITPSADEVAEVYCIPFSELDSDAIPVFEPGMEEGRPVLCSEFPALGHRMYSPTAAIVYQFREVAIRGRSTRVHHYDQPRFAWQ